MTDAETEKFGRPPEWAVPMVRVVAERVIDAARPAARACGYALAVHGSLARDVDLIAIPWTEDATGAEELVARIKAAIGEALGHCYEAGDIGRKPHGRRAWTLILTGGSISTRGGSFPFIDLSVMPLEARP